MSSVSSTSAIVLLVLPVPFTGLAFGGTGVLVAGFGVEAVLDLLEGFTGLAFGGTGVLVAGFGVEAMLDLLEETVVP